MSDGAPSNHGGPGTGLRSRLDNQITDWWQEVEAAVCHSHPARARRFLRWIITCHPDEEEAWLALAHLAQNPDERLQILHKAYIFHPDSLRVIRRLSEARTEFLQSTVGDVVRPRHLIRCLPDERRLPQSGNGLSHNGNGTHPPDQNGHRRGWIARFLRTTDHP